LLAWVLPISLVQNNGNYLMPMNHIRHGLHTWLTRRKVRCIGGSFVEMESVDDVMKTRANLLANQQRLAYHKSEKVDANKQLHFTLGWLLDNDHMRAELDTINKSLLVAVSNQSF
jgi:hypothetical protein